MWYRRSRYNFFGVPVCCTIYYYMNLILNGYKVQSGTHQWHDKIQVFCDVGKGQYIYTICEQFTSFVI